MHAHARTRAEFYQTVSTYVVVYGVLPSNPLLSSRRTETIEDEEEDYTDWYAKENAFSNRYTTCLRRLFNKHLFLRLHSIYIYIDEEKEMHMSSMRTVLFSHTNILYIFD